MIVLTPARQAELTLALLESFKAEDLERRVMDPLRVPSTLRSTSRNVEDRVRALVEWAMKEDRVADLLRVAREANRTSERVQLLSEALGLVPPTGTLSNALGGVVDAREWRRRLLEVQRQVCVVDLGRAIATGFLVGPDQVMTHRILFSHESQGPAAALREPQVKIRFDDTAERPYRFRSLVFEDPASAIVVLQLDREAGREISASDIAASRARGWIVGSRPAGPRNDKAIVIVQHSDGNFFSVSADAEGFVSADGDTIRYRTSTLPGSAGAPCFDSRWQLLGMHERKAPDDAVNEGIAIEAILRDLSRNGLNWSVSEGIVRIAADTRAREVPSKKTDSVSLDAFLSAIDVDAASVPEDDDAWESEAEVNDESWSWAEAASVVASFVPEALRPIRPAPESARVAVVLESQRVGNRWMISDRLRTRALRRLADRGELKKARELNRGSADDPLDAMLGACIAGTPQNAADMRDPERLRALRQVAGWLQGIVPGLPRTEDLDAALQRATLLAPFRHLTRGFFAGRETEITRLTEYVQNTGGATIPKPLFIHGPGGMGKSALLSHFILAHSERDPSNPAAWRPFVYLDFDRPDLDARDLTRILLGIARQLGPQVPAVAAEARALVERHRSRRKANVPRNVQRVAKRRVVEGLAPPVDDTALRADVLQLIRRVTAVLPEPILLVFDALEEVQYANADAIAPVVDLATALRKEAPFLRPVLAGRIEPDSKALLDRLDPLELGPLRPSIRETLLSNQLPPQIAARTDIVRRMAESVGGNPLSLRLAAEALRREENVEELVTSLEGDLWKRVGDAIVQGRLYERILGHITDKDVKALAYPGLVLRKITKDLIKDVLAGPCNLKVDDDATADALFRKLTAEVALVRQGDSVDELELRPELRRIVIEDFKRDAVSHDRQQKIHQAAVTFYAARFARSSNPEDRAEEIYHRLALDEDPRDVDKLWIAGIDHLLRSAVDDFAAERARSYLANRVGHLATAEAMRTASPEEWEAWAERRASDLLRFQSASRALQVLAMRPDRLPTSRLHLIESVARRSISPPDLDGALKAANLAVESARRSHDTSYLNEALQEVVLVNRLRDDTAGVLAALAQLGDLGYDLGDDLVTLQAAVEGLEIAPSPEAAEPRFTDTAIRVFARLPDELVARGPELARRVAAQVGGEDPATLQRVLRLVGTGSMTRKAANGLQDILKSWAERAPDIAPFVPAAKAGVRDIASATQYLVSNRTLDKATATELTGWLKASSPGITKEF